MLHATNESTEKVSGGHDDSMSGIGARVVFQYSGEGRVQLEMRSVTKCKRNWKCRVQWKKGRRDWKCEGQRERAERGDKGWMLDSSQGDVR